MQLDERFHQLSTTELQSTSGGFSLLRILERVGGLIADLLTVKPTT